MRIIFFFFLIFQISCKVNVAAQGTVNQPVPTINAGDPAPVLASNEAITPQIPGPATVQARPVSAVAKSVAALPRDFKITSIFPLEIFTGGGVPLKISGTGFSSATNIEIDGMPCQIDTLVSESEVFCTAPAHLAGTVNVLAKDGDLSAGLDAALSYSPQAFTHFGHLIGELNPPGVVDGLGAAARVKRPGGMWPDGDLLYFSEYDTHVLRVLDTKNGQVTTLAGVVDAIGYVDGIGSEARLNWPVGVVKVGDFLFFSDSKNHIIRKLNLMSRQVSHFAGTPQSAGVVDGSGSAAKFNTPEGMTTDGINLYIAEYSSSCIRQVVIETALVSTLAGACGTAGNVDGIGTAARFNKAETVFYSNGKLYVGNTSGHNIRVIDIATKGVTTLAGAYGLAGPDDGIGTAAKFHYPRMTTILGNTLYVADSGTTVRAIDLTSAAVSTIAGVYQKSGHQDGVGASARLNYIHAIATIGNSIFLGTVGSIRRIDPVSHNVSMVAGALAQSASIDGSFETAVLKAAVSVAIDGDRILVGGGYVEPTIRSINLHDRSVVTLAGSSDATGTADGVGIAARLNSPGGIVMDGDTAYFLEMNGHCIRKIDLKTNEVTTIAGLCGTSGRLDGTGSTARFSGPFSMTLDSGNLYIADSVNIQIRKLDLATLAVSTFAGKTNGALGSGDAIGTGAAFYRPRAIVSKDGSLFVADSGNALIRKIALSTGEVTTVAGVRGNAVSVDGAFGVGSMYLPFSLAMVENTLYIGTIPSIRTLRKLDLATNALTTFMANPGFHGDANHSLQPIEEDMPSFFGAYGLAFSPTHGLIIANTSSIKIIK